MQQNEDDGVTVKMWEGDNEGAGWGGGGGKRKRKDGENDVQRNPK